MHRLRLAVRHRNLSALLELDCLTIGSSLGRAGGCVLHLAVEGVGHPDIGGRRGFVVPQLLPIRARDLRDNEADGLGDQLALLPRHGLAGLITGPNLLAILVGLPEGDTVLLRHVLTLGQHLGVGDNLLSGLTLLLHELLSRQLRLAELLRLDTHGALGVRLDLTLSFSNIGADILGLRLALLDKDRVADLPVPLHPHDGLVGRDVNAELLVMQINGLSSRCCCR